MKFLDSILVGRKFYPNKSTNKNSVGVLSRTFKNWFGLSKDSLSISLDAQNIKSISLGVDSSAKDSHRFNLSPQSIQSIIRYPICIELEVTFHELEAENETRVKELIQLHTARTNVFAAQIFHEIAKSKPNAIAIAQGYDTINAVAREIAFQQNLPVIAFENTALKDRMLWDDHSAITPNRNLASNFYWRYVDTLYPEFANAYADNLISMTKQRKQDEHDSPTRAYTNPHVNKPNVLFLGQVYTDSSVLFGIRDWKTPINLIVELARLSVEMNFNLWIKLHPKEINGASPVASKSYNKLTYRKMIASSEFQQLAKESDCIMVDHDNTYDTYDLIEKADAVITINSQAGLESAIRGVPTIIAGDAFYGGHGFTFNADCPEILKIQINRALGITDEHKLKNRLASRIFTHIYFEKYCIPKTSDAVAKIIAKRCYGIDQ